MSSVAQYQTEIFDEGHRQMFLDKHGWSIESPVGRDSSIRRYFRVNKGKQTAILMETVPDGSPYATPGHALSDFLMVSQWLNAIGLNAPDIYEHDLENGYVLLEDFGEECFRDAAADPENIRDLYRLAADALEHLAAQDCQLDLPEYYESHVHRRHRRIVDWFMPLMRGRENEAGLVEDYRAVWAEIETALPEPSHGFLHVDFHAQNLMWLPKERGLHRCGILDFQGAMRGPLPYDLGNLLEDARTDVPQDIKDEILEGLGERHQAWYRVLATQFHCRVIGQFIKQAVMDDNPSYIKHIARLQHYLDEAMQDSVLAPLRFWFKEQGIDFTKAADLQNLSTLEALIDDDAQ